MNNGQNTMLNRYAAAQSGQNPAAVSQASGSNLNVIPNMKVQSTLNKFFPTEFTIEQTAAAGITTLRFDNPLEMFAELGIAQGALTQEMDVVGQVTAASVRRFIRTYALIIAFMNYDSDVAAQLNNAIKLVRTTINSSNGTESLEFASSRRNTQFDATLLTLKQPFVYDHGVGFFVATEPTRLVTITFKIEDVVAYGNLNEYLANSPLLSKVIV